MAPNDEESHHKPLSLVIPEEFYDDLDRRIQAAVDRAVGKASNKNSGDTKYLTRKEVCEILQISLPTLHSYCKRGLIRARKIGHRVLFTEKQIQEALQELPSRFSQR